MLWGKSETRIDDKGRINVPAKFREILKERGDDRLFLTNRRFRDVRCLDAWPQSEWLKLLARVEESTTLSAAAKDFWDGFYSSEAEECPIDNQGRVLVPPSLREYAGLVKEVMFATARDKFRIWDKAKWQLVHDAVEQIGVSEPGVITELGL